MEVVGEAVLSALLQPMFERLTSIELLKFASKKQLHGELDKWKTILHKIHEVLNDAEEKQITKPSVKDWLSKLQDLAYDADDLLDEFATEAMTEKIREKCQANTSKVLRIPSCWNDLKPSAIHLNIEIGSRLKEITARLQEIVTEKDAFGLRMNREQRPEKVHNRDTTSLMEPKVYGREKDKEAIVEWLMSGEISSSNFSVISIVSMGGVGKTTLAQCVFNDEKVEFDCKAWVCVSEIFDIRSISKAILSKLGGYEADDLDSLQVKLKEQLYGKKFMIVLDDVWNEDYVKWTKLCSPFVGGAPGSKIIVTTRSKDVSSMVGSTLMYELKELSNDDCLSLFAQHVLGVENFNQHPILKERAQEIAKRCRGLPLIAKTLGGLLRGKQHAEEWEDILNSKIWDLDDNKIGILPSLRLSYHHLPSHLKQCFAFCGVFPKDFEFNEDELVLLWMAEGFLQHPTKRMDLLGHKYFKDLVSKSFFQQSVGDNSKYVMHDLISDLAQYVSREICLNLGDKLKVENYKSLSKARYVAFTQKEYDVSERFELLHQMRGLRMFLSLSNRSWCYLSSHVINNLVSKLKTLRVLSLADYQITELPSSIAGLKHLRLLDLSNSLIEMLPESLCKLCNMQTLILLNCIKLTRLPEGFSNLINLHYLDIRGTYKLQEMPLGISNLMNLSTLSKFVIGKDKGRGIGELKELSHLQGYITIEGLDNVGDIQDIEDANLKAKHDLNKLSLRWSSRFDESRDKNHNEEVLIALQPSQSIKKLSISFYAGTSFPSWVGDISFEHVVNIGLYDCRNVTSMPPLGELPSLKDLIIQGMDKIKELGSEFYSKIPASFSSQSKILFQSLETLKISDMTNLEQWSNDPIEETITRFQYLRELRLENCPQLVRMYPDCLPSLKNLYIRNCEKLSDWPRMIPSLSTLTVDRCNEILLKHVPNLSSLTHFYIGRVVGLEHLNKELIGSLGALEDIEIRSCNNLKYLCKDGVDLKKLSLLKSLEVYDCKEMVSLMESGEGIMPRNLQTLRIYECYELEKLPNGFKNLTGLSSLVIFDCPKLEVFLEGGLPNSITDVKINYCKSLKELPKGIMKNSDENILSPNLRSLEIRNCPSLIVNPSGYIPRSLERLAILDLLLDSVMRSSPNLTSLTDISISGSLGNLNIWGATNLSALSNLTSLQSLSILGGKMESFVERCLPSNLSSLSIESCGNLKQPMSEWGLHRLTSLTSIEISGRNPSTDLEVSFPNLQLPTSLTKIQISNFKNLKSILSGIQQLTSLKELEIRFCPNLWRLPRSGFCPTLQSLEIYECPLLKAEKCIKKYVHITANVPYIQINKYYIIGGKIVDDPY